jgi:phage protein D
MLTPAYRITVGGKVVDTTDKPQASTVIDLDVTLDLEVPADRAVLVLGNVGGLHPARGDNVTIELGYADDGDLVQVMTGTVVALEPNLRTTRVVCFAAANAVLRTVVDQTYEGKTAGAIVRDLADGAGVDVEKADDGITFPAYVVDGRRSPYLHMMDLAALCGFDVYVNSDGKLVFQKFAGGNTVHDLEYARHILDLEIVRRPAQAGQVQAWGESPTGKQGEGAWGWLTPDFSGSRGSAGSATPVLLLERPALRTADAARTAAESALTAIKDRTLRGRLRTTGWPAIQLGDAVRLSGLADSTLNTTFGVRSVCHRIRKREGFMTIVEFQAIGG